MSSGVLQIGPLIPSLQEALRTSYDAVRLPDDPAERPAFLAANADAVRVIVTAGVTGSPRIDAELIASLPSLAAVVYCAVGYDSIDLAAQPDGTWQLTFQARSLTQKGVEVQQRQLNLGLLQ